MRFETGFNGACLYSEDSLIYYKMQRKIYLHQCFLRLSRSSLIMKGHLEILFQNALNKPVLDFYDNYA